MPLDLSTVVSGIGIIYAEQSDDKDVELLKQKNKPFKRFGNRLKGFLAIRDEIDHFVFRRISMLFSTQTVTRLVVTFSILYHTHDQFAIAFENL
ncbi:MAG: hypothetical protein IJB68_00300 [Ruminococcus sp.]|nr:hypothetical protein [Ruminococcus sp.]